jgi:hypothetical protein
MRYSSFSKVSAPSSALWTDRHRAALCLLRKAAEAARKEEQDVWQFAVEIGQLHALGLSNTDLRNLLCWGFLEHAQERKRTGSSERMFRPISTLALPRQTCFVLTAKGLEFASQPSIEEDEAGNARTAGSTAMKDTPPQIPHWDSQLRQLSWQSCLIKEFQLRRLYLPHHRCLADCSNACIRA